MPQDAYTLKYIAEELNSILVGAKVNKAVQPEKDEFSLYLYKTGKNYKLTLSCNPAFSRVDLSSAPEKTAPSIPFNFVMLLRKHLIGAVISAFTSSNFERVIKIEFDAKNEFLDNVKRALYVEIMGKYSNVFLTENEKILGAARSLNLEQAATRPMLVGSLYSPPPEQVDRIAFSDREKLTDALSGGATALYSIRGISRETADDMAAKIDCSIPERAYEEIGKYLFDKEINPCVSLTPAPSNFFVKPVAALKNYTYFSTVLEAQNYFYSNKESAKTFDAAKKAILSKVKAYEKKQNKKLNLILSRELDCSDIERNRVFGDLLINNLYRLKSGDEVTVENYYDDSRPVTIPLDKKLSIQNNAQKYYKKYNKQKRTLNALVPQKKEVLAELDYISSLYGFIERTEDASDFAAINEELIASGILSTQNKKSKTDYAVMYMEFSVEGFTLRAGKNNLQNDYIFSSAAKDDLWLHVKDYHGSHVVIETNSKSVPDKVIECAAEIAAFYSRGNVSDKVAVDCATRRHVKKPPKAKPGGVIYTDYTTYYVTPDKHAELAVIKKRK